MHTDDKAKGKQALRRSSLVNFVMLAMVCCGIATACVDSRCFRHPDCPAGQVCELGTGRCVVPACTIDSECSPGTVCESYSCVEGCLVESDCPPEHQCIGRRCLLFRDNCQCPALPDFCLEDVNPGSPSETTDVCLPASVKGDSVVLVFGSVGCGTCRELFRSVSALAERVVPRSGKAYPIFMNLTGVGFTSSQIESWMPDVQRPILQDTLSAGVWGRLGADWYHLILLDRNGCLVQHWGPVSVAELDQQLGTTLLAQWEEATGAECSVVPLPDVISEVTDLPDVQAFDDVRGETGEPDGADPVEIMDQKDAPDGQDVLPDSLDDADTPDAHTQTDLSELLADIADDTTDGDAITDVAEDTALPPEIFALTPVCQMEVSEPPEIGELVPHFLCMDRNESSATTGLGVSDWTLRESVWIAYFGACT